MESVLGCSKQCCLKPLWAAVWVSVCDALLRTALPCRCCPHWAPLFLSVWPLKGPVPCWLCTAQALRDVPHSAGAAAAVVSFPHLLAPVGARLQELLHSQVPLAAHQQQTTHQYTRVHMLRCMCCGLQHPVPAASATSRGVPVVGRSLSCGAGAAGKASALVLDACCWRGGSPVCPACLCTIAQFLLSLCMCIPCDLQGLQGLFALGREQGWVCNGRSVLMPASGTTAQRAGQPTPLLLRSLWLVLCASALAMCVLSKQQLHFLYTEFLAVCCWSGIGLVVDVLLPPKQCVHVGHSAATAKVLPGPTNKDGVVGCGRRC